MHSARLHVVYLNWDEPVDREMHSVTPSDLKDVKYVLSIIRWRHAPGWKGVDLCTVYKVVCSSVELTFYQ